LMTLVGCSDAGGRSHSAPPQRPALHEAVPMPHSLNFPAEEEPVAYMNGEEIQKEVLIPTSLYRQSDALDAEAGE
ncbi:MAG: hypothetical protein ACE5JM_00215, partial [Armatimonadota bacterium]